LPTVRARVLGTYFLRKKLKNPLFAKDPAMRPLAKRVSKTVNLRPPLKATFLAGSPQFALDKGFAESLEFGCSAKTRGREKIPGSPLPRATLGKGFAKDAEAFAESFRRSAKPECPVVVDIFVNSHSCFHPSPN
jgi:hypothetical protein